MGSTETAHKGDGNSGLWSYWNDWEMYRLGRQRTLDIKGFSV